MLGCPRLYFKKTAIVVCVMFFLGWLRYGPDIHSANLSLRKAIHDSRISKLQSGCHRIQSSSVKKEKNPDSLRLGDFVDNVFINRQHGLLYCSVAKVGCSFWKRVFKVLVGARSGKLHLYDITGPRAHVKNNSPAKCITSSNLKAAENVAFAENCQFLTKDQCLPFAMTLNNTTQKEFKNMLETYMKIIFVRDPFSRLFSAYVDKILIPSALQTQVVKYFLDENLATNERLPCNRKVSFGDFSSLLVDAIMQKNFFDSHFSTISSQCPPCKFNFTFVGKMETFMKDAREVFHRAQIDISEVVGDVEDIESTNEISSIKDITERVWLYYLSRSNDCLSNLDTAERLWKHFQIRGFISKTISLPLSQGNYSKFSLETYTSDALRAYEQSEPRHVRMRQREEAMMEAYSRVPKETLEKLSQLYADDCLLFDYSCDINRFLNHKAPQFYFRNY